MGGVYIPGQVEGVCGWGVYSRSSRGCVWVGCIFQASYGSGAWQVGGFLARYSGDPGHVTCISLDSGPNHVNCYIL